MFYHNMTISNDDFYITSQVNGLDMGLDKDILSEILGAPTV